MEESFLPHFINETVYVIKEDAIAAAKSTEVPVEQTEKVIESLSKEPETTVVSEKPIPPKFKGNNSRKVLIVVDYQSHEYISPDDEAFLSKILQAVNVPIAEVALLNLVSNPSFDYDNLLAFEAKYVLYFGDNKILPTQFTRYNLQSVANRQILLSSPLSMIASQVEEKKLLWTALKQMF